MLLRQLWTIQIFIITKIPFNTKVKITIILWMVIKGSIQLFLRHELSIEHHLKNLSSNQCTKWTWEINQFNQLIPSMGWLTMVQAVIPMRDMIKEFLDRGVLALTNMQQSSAKLIRASWVMERPETIPMTHSIIKLFRRLIGRIQIMISKIKNLHCQWFRGNQNLIRF